MSINVILSTGRGQGQVTNGHERSPKSKKNRTCLTWYMVYFARRIRKSKPLCNLTPCKPTTEKGQVNLGSHKFNFLIGVFEKICVSDPVCSLDSKNITFSVRNLEMLKIAVWKNDVHRFGFWAICLPNIDISTWKFACQMSRYGYTTCSPFFEFFDYFRLKQKLS